MVKHILIWVYAAIFCVPLLGLALVFVLRVKTQVEQTRGILFDEPDKKDHRPIRLKR